MMTLDRELFQTLGDNNKSSTRVSMTRAKTMAIIRSAARLSFARSRADATP